MPSKLSLLRDGDLLALRLAVAVVLDLGVAAAVLFLAVDLGVAAPALLRDGERLLLEVLLVGDRLLLFLRNALRPRGLLLTLLLTLLLALLPVAVVVLLVAAFLEEVATEEAPPAALALRRAPMRVVPPATPALVRRLLVESELENWVLDSVLVAWEARRVVGVSGKKRAAARPTLLPAPPVLFPRCWFVGVVAAALRMLLEGDMDDDFDRSGDARFE